MTRNIEFNFSDNSHILKQPQISTLREAVTVLVISSSWYLELKNKEVFSFLLMCLLVMSHVQATVGRGFSYNELLVQRRILPDNFSEKLIFKDNLRCNDRRLIPQSQTNTLLKLSRTKYDLHFRGK